MNDGGVEEGLKFNKPENVCLGHEWAIPNSKPRFTAVPMDPQPLGLYTKLTKVQRTDMATDN